MPCLLLFNNSNALLLRIQNERSSLEWRGVAWLYLPPATCPRIKAQNDSRKNYNKTSCCAMKSLKAKGARAGNYVRFANIFNQSSGANCGQDRPGHEQSWPGQATARTTANDNNNMCCTFCALVFPYAPGPQSLLLMLLLLLPLTCGNAVLVLVSARSCNAYSMFPDRLADRQTG